MLNNELSPDRQALLEKWRSGQLQKATTTISIRPPGSPVPLSFPQQRQLFLELLHRGTAVNNLSVLLLLKGEFSITALEQSASRILRRHESLRTRFCFRHGLPTPEVVDDACLTFSVVDLQDVHETQQIVKARQLAEKEVLQPFDLTRAPLIRLKLYVLNEKKSLLLVVAHHTVADGWSFGVFLKELTAFYAEIVSGRPASLPDLSTQYSDFAYWQINHQRKAALQSSIDYWKKQLGEELPVLELPADKYRSTRTAFSGGTHSFHIDKHHTKALEKLGRESDSTLFMTLLTVYAVLLHRYSGQSEIIIGTPVANRSLPELEDMIGVFINTLALRVKHSGNVGFREMLQKVRQLCLEAYAHQDLPFEKLVEELKPERDLSRTPVFQAVFNLQNAPMPKVEMPGIEASFLELDRGVSQFDLTLMVTKLDGECHAMVEYNNELFSAQTIATMFRSFQVLLEDVLADPDKSISTLQLLCSEEQHHLIHGLNQTKADYPRHCCVHQLFKEQVGLTPDATAIVCDGKEISYDELNCQANAVARQLQALGIIPGCRVGVRMEKTAALVAALLGVLKAGGTYLPIHPSLPGERIQFMLKDAAVRILLTDSHFQPADENQVEVLQILESFSLKQDDANVQCAVAPDHLAYIIYTSGSTGQPKGVMISHAALVNFLWAMQDRPGIKKEDVLLSVTAISFDIAALELFLPLVVGAKVVIPGKEAMANPVLLTETISHYNVTLMQATPSVWQLLLNSSWTGSPVLKALCGGEGWTRKLADQLLNYVCELWNMYGPTETTIWSSVAQIRKDDDPITIGTPIGNTGLYVLDEKLQPVPRGVIGELYIGGDGLAQGYLNNDDLTREKFITNPFCSEPGARLYKTSDHARYLHDYTIEVLGRTDDQVKIHGHRVELGEIAAVMVQHPAVQNAVAIVRTENNGEKRIVTYYVAKPEASTDINELRDFISQKLPPYMLPSQLIRLEKLPLSPNGKVDRKALPAPAVDDKLPHYTAPRNREEQILVNIWKDVLEVENVGIDDNFFDLGGTSLQSLEIVAKATLSGIPITVENIFEHQTISGLSTHLKSVS